MIKLLKESKVRPSVFLRHYWMSFLEPVRKQKLYRAYRARIDKKEVTPLDLAQSLYSSAQIYSELADPEKDNEAYVSLTRLGELGATQFLPFLLAVVETPEYKSQLKIAAQQAESLTVLYSVLGDKNPNKLEKKYSDWARYIRNGEKNLSDITIEAAKLPDTNVIEQTICGEPVREFSIPEARFLLKAITELELNGELGVASPKQVHVDHIIAKHPLTGKPIESPNRLGNLTLIKGKWNQEMSNKAFTDKQKLYNDSSIPMTKRLSGIAVFNEETMKAREQELAKLAAVLWHF